MVEIGSGATEGMVGMESVAPLGMVGSLGVVSAVSSALLLLLYGSKQSQEPELLAMLQHPTRLP